MTQTGVRHGALRPGREDRPHLPRPGMCSLSKFAMGGWGIPRRVFSH